MHTGRTRRRLSLARIGRAMAMLAVVVLISGHSARAQRPVRLTLGLTYARQKGTVYSFTFNGPSSVTLDPRYLQLGLSCDVLRRGTPGQQARVFGAVYYDYATATDSYGHGTGGGDGFSSAPRDPLYAGGGFALRAHNAWGYVGAGVGAYRSGIGGKGFVGLQGRGDGFAEVALARTAHDPPPSLTFLLGLRL